MSAKYTKYLSIIRICQSILYENAILMLYEKRLIELAIYSIAMGETEIAWEALATEGLLCKNDWRHYKKLIQAEMPEIRTRKQLRKLYE